MPSLKEYMMMFQLNAQLGGSYNTTFTRAQSAVAAMQKEIMSLTKTQSDITSFQKQQGAIESTRQKLAVLQQQHDNIQKEIQETGTFSADLENKLLSKQQQIERTNEKLTQQTQKLNEMDAALKAAGVDTGNLAQQSAQLGAKIDELKGKQEEAANGAMSFGEASAQAFATIQQAIVAAGVAAALKEITEAYMECIGIAGDFEAAMSNVEALSGATAAEMDELTAKAKELGAETKFSAQESADAMGYMAMAGWDASEMISGMDGVLQLAAASGEDLAMVSDIVTDSLSAFGLTAADTAHFSDVLAAAATNSNTNVSIMGETFKMSASIAGALGYSIEDVAVAVGLMANSGVKGSIAGTALRNTFNGLLEGVTLTSAAFGEYEYSAVKADGTMKAFGDTIDELRYYFDQMTEAERVNNAMTVAGARGYNGLLAILNATDEDYASLTASINSCTGAAQRMAAVKMDNLNGELELMNGSWEALKTTLGEQFIPEMRTLYSVGGDVFDLLNGFVQKNPALVKAVTAFIAVLGTVVVALAAYTAAAKLAALASTALSAAIPVVNIIMGVTAGVAALTAGIVGLVSAANEGIPSVKELSEAARDMNEAMAEAKAAYGETATQTAATAEVAQIYIGRLEEIEAATGGAVAGNQEYHNILALLTRTVPELAGYIDLENNIIRGGTEALREHTEAWKRDAEAQAYQDYLNGLYDEFGAVMTEAAENSILLTQAQIKLDAAEKNREDTLERMNALSAEAYKNGGMLSQEYYVLENALYGYNDEIYKAERTIKNLNKAMDEDAEAIAAAQAEIDAAAEAVAVLTGNTEEEIAAAEELARQEAALNDAIGAVTEEAAALAEAYNEAYTAAYDSISGQYSLWDEAAAVVATSAGSINSALESQVTYWQNYNTNLQTLAERSADIAGLSDMIASFADGSQESVNAIAGMAAANDEDLATMVANWQDLQKEHDLVAGSIAELEANTAQVMDELVDKIGDDIAALNMSEDAAESARETLQSFIDQAYDMLPAVQEAYNQVASAAQTALAQGGISVSLDPLPVDGSHASGLPYVPYDGYIAELHKGERVLTAQEATALSWNGGSVMISLAPVYQISGAANPEQLQPILDANNEALREMVLDVIAEAGIDAARRAYT